MLNNIQCLSLTEAANRQLIFRRIKLRRNELFTNTAIDTVQKNRIVKGNVEYIIDEIFGDEDIFDIYSDYISGKIRESNITAAMEIAA